VSTLEDEKALLETRIIELETENKLPSIQKTALEAQVTIMQTNITSLQAEIIALKNELTQNYNSGYEDGLDDGYQLGYDEGYTTALEDVTQNGWILRDPTYSEALAFIQSDTTDQHTYTPDYVCYDFTADFKNAFQQGYRCGFVYIEFTNSAHAIACFNTTDRGLIYVEPQNDEIVELTVGGTYLDYVIVDLGIIW